MKWEGRLWRRKLLWFRLWCGRSPWLWVVLLVPLLAVLYWRSTGVSVADRSRVENTVSLVAEADARLNEDVLKLRQHQLRDYDPLNEGAARIDQLLALLGQDFATEGRQGALAPVLDLWGRKRERLESFKQNYAVVDNAESHFVNLAAELSGRRGAAGLNSPLLATVSREVLEFLVRGTADDVPDVAVDLERLGREVHSWPVALQPQGRALVGHGLLILSNRLELEQTLVALTASPLPERLETAFLDYDRHFRERQAVADAYRLFLALFALVLIGLVTQAMVRLKRTAGELAENRDFLDNIANNLSEGILALDREGRLGFLNRPAERLLQVSEKALLGRSLAELLGGEESPLLQAVAEGRPYAGELWLPRKGGRFPVAIQGAPLPLGAGGYVASFRDLSDLKQAEARLHLAARVFDNLTEAMVITDSRGLIQSVNGAFTRVTGFGEGEVLGRTPGDALGSGRVERSFYIQMWRTLLEEGRWQGEIVNRRKNGEIYPEWLSITAVRDEGGQVVQYIGLFTDISDRKQAEAYIHHLAYHDTLTGLPNRQLFHDRLNTALRQAHRNRRKLAVLLLDLDRFKGVNDSLGHEVGDRLLKEVAFRLQTCLREGDTLARLGGDEFALLLPEVTTSDEVSLLASRLQGAFEQPVALESRELYVSASIGIALYPADGGDGETLLKHADVAMYSAKDAGRATYRYYLASRSERSLELLDLENDLRRALEGHQFMLFYQPQVETTNGRMGGVESLIRWNHPDKGLVMPDRFIALAENGGMIDAVGHWCLVTACRQLKQWQAEGVPVPRVAVNVSARQLRRQGFAEEVFRVLDETGLDPRCLELELTETMLAEDPEGIFATFTTLRAAGIRIALDDFGTGYSSLSYLSRYPVDVVKIDRSFVIRIAEDEEAQSVARAIILLAHGLNMRTVAEGVETQEQLDELTALGCDEIQGFYFSKPLPPQDIRQLRGEWKLRRPAGVPAAAQGSGPDAA